MLGRSLGIRDSGPAGLIPHCSRAGEKKGVSLVRHVDGMCDPLRTVIALSVERKPENREEPGRTKAL